MKQVRFAVIGAGGFARFSSSQFKKSECARLVGVHDPNAESIASFQHLHPGIKAYETAGGLLADPEVDLVYIASPPSLHHQQSLASLDAGKHVICEKPAALEVGHARQLRDHAENRNLLFVVNLMQRYNPLYAAVKGLIEQKLLGDFVHGFFENYASDELLEPDHWFWDDRMSGGIFIEHGVHFFDMFAGWLGKGEVVAAQRLSRPGYPKILDIAQCDVVYGENAPVHFFHGFNQPRILDRQEMRLQFEQGDITLHEWVPNRLVLEAVCSRSTLESLERLFPGANVTTLGEWPTMQQAKGRFKPINYDRKIRLDTGEVQPKSAVYQALLRAMFEDQLAWLTDRTRKREIDAGNAVESLAVAAAADAIAGRR